MPVHIGERLKEQRNRLHYTQQDMADFLEITPQSYSKWERDIDPPSVERIKQLCEILKCSADYLLGLVNSPDEHVKEGDLPPDEQNLLRLYRAGKIPRHVARLLGDLDVDEDSADHSTVEGPAKGSTAGKEKTA